MAKWSILLMSVFLMGCSGATRDFLKAIETGAYDTAAEAVGKYCKRATGPIITAERIEARREIRQRGGYGPNGPRTQVDGLDDKTAYGSGPVVVIYCSGEIVPYEVWNSLVR